jgi:photosystem II stability/assembly factor-like uncharacterized protein
MTYAILNIGATQTTIYHDLRAGTVYVSSDEGKSWNKADGVPEGQAAMVVEHPFDKTMVRVLALSINQLLIRPL